MRKEWDIPPAFISEKEARRIKDGAERDIVLKGLKAGYHITYGPGIRCTPPVPGKNGQPKTVTGTDFLFTDPDNGDEMIVEVTNGNGKNPSKMAQSRVVEQAGVENYRVIGIAERAKLSQVKSPRDLLLLFREIFK